MKRKPGAPKGSRNAAKANPRSEQIACRVTRSVFRALADEGAPLGRSAHQQAQHIVTEHIGSGVYCMRCEGLVEPVDDQGDSLCPNCGLML